MRIEKTSSSYGQSLVELLIGIAVVAIISGSVAGALFLSVRTNKQSATSEEASSLGQELFDHTKSLSEGSWNAVYSQPIKSSTSTYHLDATSTISIATGTDAILKGDITYTRWFSIENVYRDANGDIVESGGIEDTSTQKITVHVEWPFFGDVADVTMTQYLTRWSRNSVSVFTDWTGSSGVGDPITRPDENYYATSGEIDVSADGKIKLVE